MAFFMSDRTTKNLNTKTQNYNLNSIQEPITTASPPVKAIIKQVLQLEKDKLYLKTPRNINEDILKIIKQIIK